MASDRRKTTRREFLRNSTAGTAAPGILGAPAVRSVLGTNKLLHYEYRKPWTLE